jgi:hypothetical protein
MQSCSPELQVDYFVYFIGAFNIGFHDRHQKLNEVEVPVTACLMQAIETQCRERLVNVNSNSWRFEELHDRFCFLLEGVTNVIHCIMANHRA